MIGLMGVEDNGKTLITPKGNKICTVPKWLARYIQRIQHWVASVTWWQTY